MGPFQVSRAEQDLRLICGCLEDLGEGEEAGRGVQRSGGTWGEVNI